MTEERECRGEDHISNVARGCGFRDWRTLWEMNPELQASRPNPNLLYKGTPAKSGDVLNVESPRTKEEARSTEQHHLFRCKRVVPLVLRMRVLDENFAPVRNAEYTLEFEGDRTPLPIRRTDEEGLLEVPIPRGAERARLVVRAPGLPDPANPGATPSPRILTMNLKIGALNPIVAPDIDEESGLAGVQQRLNNLGLRCGEITGSMNAATTSAIRTFQERFGLPRTGKADLPTRAKLAEIHDSGSARTRA